MIAYLDASIVLRLVLGEPGQFAEWQRVERGIASALTEVECLRTLDRLLRVGALTDEELADRRIAVYRLMEAVELVAISRPILQRAGEPFPTPLGTLDAIHLASALLWGDAHGQSPTLATHDKALATAARSVGLEVVGT